MSEWIWMKVSYSDKINTDTSTHVYRHIWKYLDPISGSQTLCTCKSVYCYQEDCSIHVVLLHTLPFTKVCLPADVVNGDVSELFIHGWLAFLTGMSTKCRLRMLIGNMNLYLAGSFIGKRRKREKNYLTDHIRYTLAYNLTLAWTSMLTANILAMIFVKLDQNRWGHNQEVSQWHSDRVGNHWKTFTQPTKTLNHQVLYISYMLTLRFVQTRMYMVSKCNYFNTLNVFYLNIIFNNNI